VLDCSNLGEMLTEMLTPFPQDLGGDGDEQGPSQLRSGTICVALCNVAVDNGA